jgi:hypothetical protein
MSKVVGTYGASMSIYRRLYEQAHGPIPPGYHIHHKDGNHSNNDLSNLVAITAKEHYDIHYSQGDYGACWAMYRTGHMTLSPEERSALGRLQQLEKVSKGITHGKKEKMELPYQVIWNRIEQRL